MFCKNCGNQITDSAKFCPICGSAVQSVSVQPNNSQTAPAYSASAHNFHNNQSKSQSEYAWLIPNGQKITQNITLCNDGKYRWVYEMSLFKNPTIFLLVWKIFFFIFIGIFGFMILLNVFEGDMDGESILFDLKIMGIVILVMTAVIGLSMLIYAAIMGGKYVVIFEMDDRGINHRQEPSQAKKARKIGAATAVIGAAGGNLSTVGAGINSTRTEMYSEFSKTRKVKAYPRRDLIKVNGLLNHNQVYAAKEDFGFVYNYIIQRVPQKANK
ncbi:MAG: zinc ribbon domain-containing protein [Clostridiales bacterium]|nr:zinc ribbon domain-containing protein [Clostridiales bacterium]